MAELTLSTHRVFQHCRNSVHVNELAIRMGGDSRKYYDAEDGKIYLFNEKTIALPGAYIVQSIQDLTVNELSVTTDSVRAGDGEETCSVVRYTRDWNSEPLLVVVPHIPVPNKSSVDLWSDTICLPRKSVGGGLVKVMRNDRTPIFAKFDHAPSFSNATYPERGVMIEFGGDMRMCERGLHCATTDQLLEWIADRNFRVEPVKIAGRIQQSPKKVNAQIMQFGTENRNVRYDANEANIFPIRPQTKQALIEEELWRAFVREDWDSYAHSFGEGEAFVDIIRSAATVPIIFDQPSWLMSFLFRVRFAMDQRGFPDAFIYDLVMQRLRLSFDKVIGSYKRTKLMQSVIGEELSIVNPSFDEFLEIADRIAEERIEALHG